MFLTLLREIVGQMIIPRDLVQMQYQQGHPHTLTYLEALVG